MDRTRSGRQLLGASLLLAGGVLASAAIMTGADDTAWGRAAGAALMTACLAGGMLIVSESPYSRGARLAAAALLTCGYVAPAALGGAVTDLAVLSAAGAGIVLASIAATPPVGSRWCRTPAAFLGSAALLGASVAVASLV